MISASAGSGKTYRLSEVLAERIRDGRARPEAVVATTFTRKAAGELQERVRVRLITEGRPVDASRLAAARIGTVNAVCGQLVETFSFELGISPELRVLDESLAEAALKRALSEAVEGDVRQEIEDIASRVVDLNWQEAVRKIIKASRMNGLGPEDVRRSGERSVESCLNLFAPPMESAEELNTTLRDALASLPQPFVDPRTNFVFSICFFLIL